MKFSKRERSVHHKVSYVLSYVKTSFDHLLVNFEKYLKEGVYLMIRYVLYYFYSKPYFHIFLQLSLRFIPH